MRKLPISKSINLTKPSLSAKWFIGFVLLVVTATAGLVFGKKIYGYLSGLTQKARGHIEESGILPGE